MEQDLVHKIHEEEQTKFTKYIDLLVNPQKIGCEEKYYSDYMFELEDFKKSQNLNSDYNIKSIELKLINFPKLFEKISGEFLIKMDNITKSADIIFSNGNIQSLIDDLNNLFNSWDLRFELESDNLLSIKSPKNFDLITNNFIKFLGFSGDNYIEKSEYKTDKPIQIKQIESIKLEIESIFENKINIINPEIIKIETDINWDEFSELFFKFKYESGDLIDFEGISHELLLKLEITTQIEK